MRAVADSIAPIQLLISLCCFYTMKSNASYIHIMVLCGHHFGLQHKIFTCEVLSEMKVTLLHALGSTIVPSTYNYY